jgi:hypothetical protein
MRSILAASILTLAMAMPAAAQNAAPTTSPSTATPAKDKVEQSAKDATQATKDAAQATKDAATTTGQAVKDGAVAAGQTVKDAAKATGQAVSNAAAATGAAVASGGAAVSAKLDDLKDGWNIRASVIGQSVYDDQNARIGEIDDLVLTGDHAKGYNVYAIVGVGGFLGIGERKVATPLSNLPKVDGKFVMRGVTKETLKDWPEYKFTAPVSTTTTTTTTTTNVPGTTIVPPAPATTAPAPSSVPAPAPKQ